jgi:acetyl esterase/lipase
MLASVLKFEHLAAASLPIRSVLSGNRISPVGAQHAASGAAFRKLQPQARTRRRVILCSRGLQTAILLFIAFAHPAQAQQPAAPAAPPPFEEVYKMPLVYSVPGEDQAQVQRDIVYKSVEGSAGKLDLKLDVYTPHGAKPADRYPAVVLISGGGAEDPKHDFRDAGVFLSYGRVLAASGFVAITFSKRYAREADGTSHGWDDFDDMVHYLRDHAAMLHIDVNRMAFWAFSAGGALLAPVLSQEPGYAQAVICFYCVLDTDVSNVPENMKDKIRSAASSLWQIQTKSHPFPPIFIGRAGRDFESLRDSMDRFVQAALAKNLMIEVMNHPQGRHAFDILDADARSREIIQRALDFLRARLQSN